MTAMDRPEPVMPMDLRDFPPVPPLAEVPNHLRQTLLAKMSTCPRSAYLYLKYGGGALSHPLARGTLFHRFAERAIHELIAMDETHFEDDTIAKDILNEVIRESTDLVVPPGEQDDLRMMASHFSRGMRIQPENVLCVETHVSLEVGGWLVTGTIDYAEVSDQTIRVRDFKTAFLHREKADARGGMPDTDEWAGSFQTILYAMLLAFGKIDGSPFSLEGINWFEVELVHPRHFLEESGTMASRLAIIDRNTLVDLRTYLETLVAQMDDALKTWKFPAIPGKHCQECPASAECPIPAALRDYKGEIRTDEDAVRAALVHFFAQKQVKRMWGPLKDYLDVTGGPLRFGTDQILEWDATEKRSLRSKVKLPDGTKVSGREALLAAMTDATEYGVPFEPDEHFRPSTTLTLKRRTLTDAELAAEKEGSDE